MADMQSVYIKEKISLGERLQNAIVAAITMLSNGISCLLITPIIFLRTLMTKERIVVNTSALLKNPQEDSGNTLQVNIKHDDDEEWLKKHKEYFGDEGNERQ